MYRAPAIGIVKREGKMLVPNQRNKMFTLDHASAGAIPLLLAQANEKAETIEVLVPEDDFVVTFRPWWFN